MTVLLSRRAVVQAAMETTYGSAVSVTGSDGVLCADPMFTIDPTPLERNFTRDSLSPLAHIMGRKLARMEFTTELRGNGRQNSGSLSDAPIISRLFRACGYSLTAVASKQVLSQFAIGDHANTVTWVAGGTLTNTDVICYYLEVTTGGASGTAEITVTSDTAGEGNAAAAVTTATPFTLGTKGLTMTPTFTGNLAVGQRWVVWLAPTGLRLDPVSDDFESITLVMNKDGVKHTMPGAQGTFEIEAEAGNYATVKWTFTGIYTDPVDAAMATPTYERTLPSQVEYARLRLDDFSAIVNKFSFSQANDIQPRPDVNSNDGYIGTRITGRTPEGGVDPEADLVANYDFWGTFSAATRIPFQMRVGTVAGNTCWFMAPSVQYTGMTYQDRNGILTYDAGLKFSGVNSDDEVCIFLC